MKKNRLVCMIFIALFLVIMGESPKTVKAESGQVVAVELPQNLNFYLDPENEYGRGQIYSEQYRIHNYGSEPAEFSMSLSLSRVDPETDIQLCPQMWEGEPENRSMYMYVSFDGSQVADEFILTAGEICQKSVVLEPDGTDGDTLYISFGGALSQSEEWKSGEMAVNAVYSMPNSGAAEAGVRLVGSYIRLENMEGEWYLVPDDGYALPASIAVYADGVEANAGYDATTGRIHLEYLSGEIVIYASGITNATLPGDNIVNSQQMVWSWNAEKGVQAYEYAFFQGDHVVCRGRVPVENGLVNWNWSEGLENGTYRLCLRAIGDTVYCLNSAENSYWVTVDRPEDQELKSQENNNDGGMKVVVEPKPDGGNSTQLVEPEVAENIKEEVSPESGSDEEEKNLEKEEKIEEVPSSSEIDSPDVLDNADHAGSADNTDHADNMDYTDYADSSDNADHAETVTQPQDGSDTNIAQQGEGPA